MGAFTAPADRNRPKSASDSAPVKPFTAGASAMRGAPIASTLAAVLVTFSPCQTRWRTFCAEAARCALVIADHSCPVWLS